MEQLIKNISDTALWVAIFRADESDRPDALFHDPFARRLAGDRGEQIANKIEFSRKHSWSYVARTFLFDDFIQRHVENGFDMIVNLASGLDTRPYRMPLPPNIQWVEVDLPEILEYKQRILGNEKPACKLRSIRLDLSDRKLRQEWFKDLGREAANALIVSEGLLIYLEEADAGALADDLSREIHFRRWLLDLQSPPLLAMAQKEMGTALKEGNISFKFAPDEGEEYFRGHGWKTIESRSKLKTAASLNRLSDEMMNYAALPEPEGPRRSFPWSGACLFENMNR